MTGNTDLLYMHKKTVYFGLNKWLNVLFGDIKCHHDEQEDSSTH